MLSLNISFVTTLTNPDQSIGVMSVHTTFNSFLAGGNLCRLLITFANSLYQDQDCQNVGPDLHPSCCS